MPCADLAGNAARRGFPNSHAPLGLVPSVEEHVEPVDTVTVTRPQIRHLHLDGRAGRGRLAPAPLESSKTVSRNSRSFRSVGDRTECRDSYRGKERTAWRSGAT